MSEAPTSRQRISRMSSLAVMTPVIVCALAAGVLFGKLGLRALSTLLLVAAVVAIVSRLWGALALHHVSARIDAETETLSVGETTALTYTVQNDKLLPVMWLELAQDAPAREVLVPDDAFTLATYDAAEAQADGRTRAWRRRILFLMGMEQVSWESTWTARRRGLYAPGALTLRSGDALGLTQSMRDCPTERLFVVWPQLVPVRTEPLLRTIWHGSAGRSGHVEDPTVMRGLRAYQPSDPWKRIDWRMAARTDELEVRQFETILPASLHFILDTASFAGLADRGEEAERAISVLASLVLEFDALGLPCGLSVPQGLATGGADLIASDPATSNADLLYELAVLDTQAEGGGFDLARLSDIAQTEGRVVLVAHSGASVSCPHIADALAEEGLTLLVADSASPGALYGLHTLSFADVTIEGDAS